MTGVRGCSQPVGWPQQYCAKPLLSTAKPAWQTKRVKHTQQARAPAAGCGGEGYIQSRGGWAGRVYPTSCLPILLRGPIASEGPKLLLAAAPPQRGRAGGGLQQRLLLPLLLPPARAARRPLAQQAPLIEGPLLGLPRLAVEGGGGHKAGGLHVLPAVGVQLLELRGPEAGGGTEGGMSMEQCGLVAGRASAVPSQEDPMGTTQPGTEMQVVGSWPRSAEIANTIRQHCSASGQPADGMCALATSAHNNMPPSNPSYLVPEAGALRGVPAVGHGVRRVHHVAVRRAGKLHAQAEHVHEVHHLQAGGWEGGVVGGSWWAGVAEAGQLDVS